MPSGYGCCDDGERNDEDATPTDRLLPSAWLHGPRELRRLSRGASGQLTNIRIGAIGAGQRGRRGRRRPL